MINQKSPVKKLIQIKQNIYSLKMNLKNYRHLIQFILEEKVILKMAHKIIGFQPMYKYFKRVSDVGTGHYIYFWKSKELSFENITALTTTDCTLNPS